MDKSHWDWLYDLLWGQVVTKSFLIFNAVIKFCSRKNCAINKVSCCISNKMSNWMIWLLFLRPWNSEFYRCTPGTPNNEFYRCTPDTPIILLLTLTFAVLYQLVPTCMSCINYIKNKEGKVATIPKFRPFDMEWPNYSYHKLHCFIKSY